MQHDDAEDELRETMKRDADVVMQAARAQDELIEPPSDMQEAVRNSATPIPGNPWAFQTNEGTVFLATPADMARARMFDAIGSAKWARDHKPSNTEIDRMMKEDRDL